MPPSSALLFPRPSSSLFVAFATPSAVFSLHFPSPSPSDPTTLTYVCICLRLRLRLRLSPPSPDSDLSQSHQPDFGLSAVPTATLDRDLDLLALLPVLHTLPYLPYYPPDIIDRFCRPLTAWSFWLPRYLVSAARRQKPRQMVDRNTRRRLFQRLVIPIFDDFIAPTLA
ncbi:hypothetical protein FJTKL_08491 [Diaporthe vaccinii]|uniref:Uncharacterized protein n=1 Tax=Diaporthe vaccinii TaxID=105482 RepID=A0ABR4ER82_9PEZI